MLISIKYDEERYLSQQCPQWGLEKSELPWGQKYFIAVDVIPLELLAYQVSMVCALYT